MKKNKMAAVLSALVVVTLLVISFSEGGEVKANANIDYENEIEIFSSFQELSKSFFFRK